MTKTFVPYIYIYITTELFITCLWWWWCTVWYYGLTTITSPQTDYRATPVSRCRPGAKGKHTVPVNQCGTNPEIVIDGVVSCVVDCVVGDIISVCMFATARVHGTLQVYMGEHYRIAYKIPNRANFVASPSLLSGVCIPKL